ncbi:MAG: hypothetical protein AB7J37_12550 [Candidatus Melainabacteria bacterium]
MRGYVVTNFSEHLDGYCGEDVWTNILTCVDISTETDIISRVNAAGRTIFGLFRSTKLNSQQPMPMQTGENPDVCRWAL